MKKYNLIILIFFTAFSCKNHTEKKEELITFKNALDYSENTILFDDVRFVKLENNMEGVVGENVKMKVYDDKIYILDNETQGSLLCFDSEGNFINKTGHKGKGPEEYLSLSDFCIHNDTIDLLVQNPESYIYSYSSDGSFIRKLEVPQHAASFECLSDGNYIINSQYSFGSKKRLFVMDRNGKEQAGFLPISEDMKIDLQDPGNGLCKLGGNIIFCEPFNDTIYTVKNNSLTPKYLMGLGAFTNSDINVSELFSNPESLMTILKRGMSAVRSVGR